MEQITFEQLPSAVLGLYAKLDKIEILLQRKSESEQENVNRWFNFSDLCQYLPDKPAKQTVYGWIGKKESNYSGR